MKPSEKIINEVAEEADILEMKEAENERLKALTFPEMSKEELIDILSLNIKEDDSNKVCVFMVLLSTYTNEDQLNLIFSAPSSAGKSYIATTEARLFPEEDIIDLAYASPTSFYHRGEYREATKDYLVDLSNKIILFLDMKSSALLQNLRPLFSHDLKEIKLEITDRSKKNIGNRSKRITIRGYCSVLFCSASNSLDEQEGTRFIILSPEITQEKLKLSLIERVKKDCNTDVYNASIDADPRRNLLKERIKAIKANKINNIIIPDELSEKIKDYFIGKRKLLKPRCSRDVSRLIAFSKIFCLLNLWNRKREGDNLYATEQDFTNALSIWNSIAEAQELGISPNLLQIYKEVILALWNEKNEALKEKSGELECDGLLRSEIAKKHLDVYERALTNKKLAEEVIPMLEFAGLISHFDDPTNKSRKLIKPMLMKFNS